MNWNLPQFWVMLAKIDDHNFFIALKFALKQLTYQIRRQILDLLNTSMWISSSCTFPKTEKENVQSHGSFVLCCIVLQELWQLTCRIQIPRLTAVNWLCPRRTELGVVDPALPLCWRSQILLPSCLVIFSVTPQKMRPTNQMRKDHWPLSK